MTYCFACIYKGAAFLIADSAATRTTSANSKETSSLGEAHRKIKHGFFEECLLKIAPIARNIAVAYSTSDDAQIASQMVAFLREQLVRPITVAEAFGSMTKNFGPFDKNRGVSLLLAGTTNEGPFIGRWTTRDGFAGARGGCLTIGSMPEFNAHVIEQFFHYLVNRDWPPEHFLGALTAHVQAHIVNDAVQEEGVGGLICGARIKDGEFSWQEASVIVLYDRGFVGEQILISTFVRDNILIASSTKTDEVRVFAHSAWPPTVELLERLGGEVREQVLSNRFKYWTFINTMEREIVLLAKMDPDVPSELFRLSFAKQGHVALCFGEEFKRRLQLSPAELGHDGQGYAIELIVE